MSATCAVRPSCLQGGLAAARGRRHCTALPKPGCRSSARPWRARRRRCAVSTPSCRMRGCARDDPSAALPRPASERPLPKILDHRAVDALFAEIERRKAAGKAGALRLAALIELLYGSGLRATELVSLPRNAVQPDKPFLILRGKGERERLVPISDRARAAVAEHAATVPRDALWLFPVGQEASEPGPALPAGARACRRRRHPAGADQPARASPRLRHPFAGGRRRSARGADAARPCRHRDHPDLHPCRLRAG